MSIGCAPAISFPTSRSNVLSTRPVIGVVDGRFGFGQTMAPMAVDIGVEKAKATGLSAISLRNSGHIGRVGEWAERAAAAGLISIHFVNAAGSILVAPFGGPRAAAVDGAVLRRRSARGRPARRARFRNLAGRRRQGQCRKPRRQAAAARRFDRSRRRVLRRSRAALRPADLGGDARPHAAALGAIRAFGEHKGSGPRAALRAPGRIAHRQWRDRTGPQIRERHVLALPRPQANRSLARLRRRYDALSRLVPAKGKPFRAKRS